MPVVVRRERRKKVCARVALDTLLGGRSSAALDRLMFALLALLAAAPGDVKGSPVPPEVAQVVLTKLIADIPSSKLVLCLQINGTDPTKALLRNLQRPDRTVVAGSECHPWIDVDHGDYYIKSGQPAHFLRVSDAVWISQTTVDVQAQEHYHGLWAKFWTVRLTKNASGWQIVSFHEDGEA
jgi:hypothetical protein